MYHIKCAKIQDVVMSRFEYKRFINTRSFINCYIATGIGKCVQGPKLQFYNTNLLSSRAIKKKAMGQVSS